jgi:transposase-like protein
MESASSGKSRKPRRKFIAEFKAEAIKLCSEPGRE